MAHRTSTACACQNGRAHDNPYCPSQGLTRALGDRAADEGRPPALRTGIGSLTAKACS